MINFMRLKFLYFLLSALFLIPGIVSLVLYGFRPSIDFTGGAELEVQVQPNENSEFSAETLNTTLQGTEGFSTVTSVQGKTHQYVVHAQPISNDQKTAIIEKIKPTVASVQEVRFETVGPILGKELIVKTLYALLISATGITVYVAFRFKNLKYGVCAVLAMLHDTFILLGSFSLLGHFMGVEVDTLFVTAVLTILSFSVHDTIVVYDRIRELQRKTSGKSYVDIVNKAVTETLSRSINNSMTIIFMLLALWLLGGETIRWFVFALLIGTVTGTYSSTFTAAPLLIVWDEVKAKITARKK